jgi:hypothetical protein
VVDAVQAVKATSDRGDVKYPIKVFKLTLSENCRSFVLSVMLIFVDHWFSAA